MKKLGLTIVAAFCFAVATFASENNPTIAKWEGNINVQKLSKYLNLSSIQSQEVAYICEFFSTEIGKATTAKKNQANKLHQAIYGNLKLMKETLTSEQYTKYVTLMNMTLKNRGIDMR